MGAETIQQTCQRLRQGNRVVRAENARLHAEVARAKAECERLRQAAHAELDHKAGAKRIWEIKVETLREAAALVRGEEYMTPRSTRAVWAKRFEDQAAELERLGRK